MLSLERCRQILGLTAQGMSDEQVRAVRDEFVSLAHLVLRIAEEKNMNSIKKEKFHEPNTPAKRQLRKCSGSPAG